MHPSQYLPRVMPEPLKALVDLALDMRWNWCHLSEPLWQYIDPDLWAWTRNPWFILGRVEQERLNKLAEDPGFLRLLDEQLKMRAEVVTKPGWFEETYGKGSLGIIAYLSMEFGLGESLPIYSGGLGILAGDYLKTASDLGLPVVGIGLLFHQGYFRQALDANGNQLEFFLYNNPTMMPITPVRDERGDWLKIKVMLPQRELILRVWEVKVGRVRLYLLDSNDPLNTPGDRGITGKLYEGGEETRLQQEIVLGIGGWRLLEALGLNCEILHLNEGHVSFAVIERARSFMKANGQPFQVALACTRVANIFTTHTPVLAAFDRYRPNIFLPYARFYAQMLEIPVEEFMALGRSNPEDHEEPFNMAYLAVRGCGVINGVSHLHGRVSRRIFQPLFSDWPQKEVPVGYVTNGIHVPSWDSNYSHPIWAKACGEDFWLGISEDLEEKFAQIGDEELWEFRCASRLRLISFVRRRMIKQRLALGLEEKTLERCQHLLDPNTLTIGFARRFTAYKRPNLLLHDPDRLERLLTNQERPVQLIIAGKAHPEDEEGKRMIRAWIEFLNRPQIQGRAVFIVDYDMTVAFELVQGVDLWINTPRRPWEACGTSGMKVLVNGGLNLSVLDGWWEEAYSPEVGWALPHVDEGLTPGEVDAIQARELYRLLEEEIVPAFYDRDDRGIPTAWVAKIRTSMAKLTPRFSSNRMLREYTEKFYLSAARRYRERVAGGGDFGVRLQHWRQHLKCNWSKLHFGKLEVQRTDEGHLFRVQVYLGEMDQEAVRVELYAEPLQEDGEPERWPMKAERPLLGFVNSYVYSALVKTDRPADHYTPRIVPHFPGALIPLDDNHILWLERKQCPL
ncbi:glycosyltransferase family 1 protein [Thermosulfuriphilus ammonigenes]|uniref:Glycosyltransferase family 1 protein n=1 Tax=Thermosulfuriphilus ammonigenes TaxID=1936021 RepID=A0A6G7PXI3_9BACT|nr:alpha-glucan family phosphorylase [Thermosulfuriphilus ammonigenes]MBA2849327.1 starch phosphorylase [Thermosulfuriphilus ammonigenes]QIJ72405.1 glycosyltransferase family 1 protein [Thermosulfuriphilus ammonigenes]